MSDGLTESRRWERAQAAARAAAEALRDALEERYDRVFGVPEDDLEVVNDELKDIGLVIVRRERLRKAERK